VKRLSIWLLACVSALLLAVAMWPAGVSGAVPGAPAPHAGLLQTDGMIPFVQADPLQAAPPGERLPQITVLDVPGYNLDMTELGLRPLPQPLPFDRAAPNNVPGSAVNLLRLTIGPDGGAIGTQNAYMIASPDVVSQSTASAIGTVLSSFTPGESVQYYVNGSLASTLTASSTGRVGVSINTGAGQGYITFEGIGLTSGKRAGTVVAVHDAAPRVPGFAAAPHAFNTVAGNSFNVMGTRFPASVNVTLYRNGTSIGTAATDANGRFYVAFTPGNNGDTSAIYTAYYAGAGTSGASLEERVDAGTPPQGDSNLSRLFIDRPIFNSSGAIVALVGEGFQPGETVNATTCATLSATANANGAVAFWLSLSGTGRLQCILTGATSGRIARGTVQGNSNTTNAPSGINMPATIRSGAANFTLLIDRLAANQSGTVYVDGASQGTVSTNGSGYVAVIVPAPAAVGIHSVRWVGANGQVAIAPLYVIPALATPTPTRTPTPPTSTPTPTRTNTPVPTATNTTAPTATNTPVPTSTNTPIPTDTNTPVPTPTGTFVPSYVLYLPAVFYNANTP
jgi:hypothetical protein